MPKREDYQLRPMTEYDLETVLNWRNSERIRANMYTDHIINWEEHQAWYKKIKDDSTSKYLICEFQGQAIGLVSFTDIDLKNRRCCWGFYVGQDKLQAGNGNCLGFISIEYIFESPNIRKVCSEVLDFNEKSLNLHRKLGFKQEGRFEKHMYKNNEYQDVICLALFREDWLINKSNLSKIVFRDK